jgi:hypothetical protein
MAYVEHENVSCMNNEIFLDWGWLNKKKSPNMVYYCSIKILYEKFITEWTDHLKF